MSEKEKGSLFEKASPFFVLLSVVLAFFVGVLWQKTKNLENQKVQGVESQQNAANAPSQPQQPTVSLDTIKGLFDKDVIKFGDKNRKVIFVEASDVSCPFCSIASGKNPELNRSASGGRFRLVSDGGSYQAPVPEMKKLLDEGKASFVYIYFPGHGNGEMGAKALYCAYEMGKFWEVHDLLMSGAGYDLVNEKVRNDKTKSGDLAQFLKSAVDPDKMKECLDSGKYDERLNRDVSLAQSLGVSGTPGFFVNDKMFAGAYSFSEMKSVVDSALK